MSDRMCKMGEDIVVDILDNARIAELPPQVGTFGQILLTTVLCVSIFLTGLYLGVMLS